MLFVKKLIIMAAAKDRWSISTSMCIHFQLCNISFYCFVQKESYSNTRKIKDMNALFTTELFAFCL
uniref:YbaK/prolyl-tRNA synthetase family protein n=1 Tax=Rhizophora mucronata TaxID=61149 RepID=A0A2P2JUD8_RHIMU